MPDILGGRARLCGRDGGYRQLKEVKALLGQMFNGWMVCLRTHKIEITASVYIFSIFLLRSQSRAIYPPHTENCSRTMWKHFD